MTNAYSIFCFVLFVVLLCDYEHFVFAKPLSKSAAVQWSTKTKHLRTFSTADAVKYLRSYGYLPNTSEKNGWSLHFSLKLSELEWALRNYQRFSGLPVTGKLDVLTRWKMKQPRCGVEDLSGNHSIFLRSRLAKVLGIKLRKKRFAVQGSMFRQSEVTWGIKTFSAKMSRDYVEKTVRRAFRTWETNIPKNFIQMHYNTQRGFWECPEKNYNCNRGRSTPDIEIRFATGHHGDNKPFDGTGEALAHAFYPDDLREPGNIHFDDDEPWGPTGRNFLWVASHEIGHSLGLEHSDNRESLMHSEYSGHGVGQIKLHADDLAGIQKIYGKRMIALPPEPEFDNTEQRSQIDTQVSSHRVKTTSYTVTTTTPTTTTTTNPRETAGTATLSYLKSAWRWPQTGNWKHSVTTRPRPLFHSRYAAYTTTTPATIQRAARPYRPRPQWTRWTKPRTTAKRQPYWYYYHRRTVTTPAPPARRGSPAAVPQHRGVPDICKDSSLDAIALLGDGKVYAFKGEYYWVWDRNFDKFFDRTPKKITDDWDGLESNLNTVFTDDFQYTWVLKNNRIWQYEMTYDNSLKKLSGPTYAGNSEFYGQLKSRIDAALSFNTGAASQPVYFFSGHRYWRDATYDGEVDKGHYIMHTREIASNIGRVIGRVDAAVYLNGRQPAAYIFSGQHYYRVEEFRNRLRTEPGSNRKRIGPDWFGCPS